MSKYQLVIFDLDGTLLDTSEGIISAVNYTIHNHGLTDLSLKEIESFIGPPVQVSFKKYFNLSDDRIMELTNTFRNRYKDYDLLKATAYGGIYDVFSSLKRCGVRTAVATYKRQDYASMILEHFNFDQYTDIMLGADHFNKLSKSDIIKLAIEKAQITDYSKVVMVGDSDNDAIGAKNLGIDFIGVTYGFGFHSINDVNRFDNIAAASKPSDITKIVLTEKK